MTTNTAGEVEHRPRWLIEPLTSATHNDARRLILDGLAERWGTMDASLNPDLDDMLHAYGESLTLVAHPLAGGALCGTGTVIRRDAQTAEIVRMSVAFTERRSGLGRLLVDRLVEQAAAWRGREVIVETSAAWTDALAFYWANGFAETRREVGPFGEEVWSNRQL